MKKIVIIDDEKDMAMMTKRLLSLVNPGWEVQVCTNVFDAGHMLVDFLPDLIILDVCLPSVQGNDICKFIRSHAALSHTKVLAISGLHEPEIKEQIIRDGADGFLEKPFTIEALVSRIKELLSA